MCSSLDRLSIEVIKLLLNDHGLNKPHCTCLKPLMDIFTTISKAGTIISTDLKEVGGLNVHVIHSLDAAVAVEFVFTQVFPLALDTNWVSCFVCLCNWNTYDGKLMLLVEISKKKKKKRTHGQLSIKRVNTVSML